MDEQRNEAMMPAKRVGADEIRELREAFLSFDVGMKLLEAVPDLAVVLSSTRQIVAVNNALIQTLGVARPDELIGMRPGEIVDCIHAHEADDGCGSAPSCLSCDALQTVLDAIYKHEPAARDCRIQTFGERNGGALDMYVKAVPVSFGDRWFFVVSMRDISGEKETEAPEALPESRENGIHDAGTRNTMLSVISGLGFIAGEPVMLRFSLQI